MNKEKVDDCTYPNTASEFVTWYRKNRNTFSVHAPQDASLFSEFCGLMIRGKIDLGEITQEDLEEKDRFWECLKNNGFRRMPNEEEYEIIEKTKSKGQFLS